MKLIYFDFEDSFSWNIVKYLEEFFKEVEVVPLVKFPSKAKEIQRESGKGNGKEKEKENGEDNHSLPQVFVFGPGPKRPSDYKNLLPLIKSEIKKKKNFLVGICLGHQALMQSCGFTLGYSQFPSHGIQVSLAVNEEWKKLLGISQNTIDVQRYNSLCVREDKNLQKINDYKILLDEHNEIMIFHARNILSFQFHPESIGTKNPEYFFASIERLARIQGKKGKNGPWKENYV